MKYLQYERLEIVSNYLSSFSPSDYQIQGRVEAFSCKDTVEDKKLRRFVEARYSLAAGGAQALYSDQRIARKYFFYLLATLNAVFPDYDYRYFSRLLALPMLLRLSYPSAHLRSSSLATSAPMPSSCYLALRLPWN